MTDAQNHLIKELNPPENNRLSNLNGIGRRVALCLQKKLEIRAETGLGDLRRWWPWPVKILRSFLTKHSPLLVFVETRQIDSKMTAVPRVSAVLLILTDAPVMDLTKPAIFFPTRLNAP